MAASHAVSEVHFSQPDDDYNIVLVLFIYLFRSSNTPRDLDFKPMLWSLKVLSRWATFHTNIESKYMKVLGNFITWSLIEKGVLSMKIICWSELIVLTKCSQYAFLIVVEASHEHASLFENMIQRKWFHSSGFLWVTCDFTGFGRF